MIAMTLLAMLAGPVPAAPASTTPAALPNPVLFVTQVPIPGDFAAIASVFGNHRADTDVVGRGGDLMIRYPDGSVRNLTAEAGYGNAGGLQTTGSIAVRDPVVHWSGTKAAFAMVVGAPTEQFQRIAQRWQLYEVTGLQAGAIAVITRVPDQPANYNNVEPAYASDGDLIFASDRPRNGAAHLYPQLDEYESRVINSGLWRLDRDSGTLTLLQHAPSGSFTPIVDSFGRIVFTRWDHLQRDQQNDGANPSTFNYSSEAADSVATSSRTEVFPTPRNPPAGSGRLGHTFNQMFPWQINQDGTDEETLAHLGRQEMLRYFRQSRSDDANLVEFSPGGRTNPNEISFTLQMREDPMQAGRFVAIDAREFGEHASGQLIRFDAPPHAQTHALVVEYLTSRQTYCCNDPAHPDHTGHYRNPLPLSDGRLVAVHTAYRGSARNSGTAANPRSPFEFRIKLLARNGTWYAPVQELTPGFVKNVSYWSPDNLISYNGSLWELSPVEVRARPVPAETGFALKQPEQDAFALEQVDINEFRTFLHEQGLGVIVVRNATARDRADRQQPFNLRVPGGVETLGANGKVYDIARLQLFQADQIRGGGGALGRRVLAQHLHDAAAVTANDSDLDAGASVRIFPDGSAAAYVPTRRALSWQTLSPAGDPVVEERYWINLQPGEVRACDGCHGVNNLNQAGQPPAQQVPAAFRALLQRWRTDLSQRLFSNGFE